MENKDIRSVVVLAAGLGTRLNPLTKNIPKCLAEINAKSILKRQIECFERNGIKETTIVVGWLKEKIMYEIGHECMGMKIKYVESGRYADTNNMYSLWLVRKQIEEGCFLVEGDNIFDENVFAELAKKDDNKSYWAVVRFTPEHDGCLSEVDSEERIIKIRIVREQLPEYRDNMYKSASMLKITPILGKMLSKWLNNAVNANKLNLYYDEILAMHIKEHPIFIYDITGAKWYEIDTKEDLEKAKEMFN